VRNLDVNQIIIFLFSFLFFLFFSFFLCETPRVALQLVSLIRNDMLKKKITLVEKHLTVRYFCVAASLTVNTCVHAHVR